MWIMFILIITIQLWDSNSLISCAKSTQVVYLSDWKNKYVLLTKSATFKQEIFAAIMKSFFVSPPELCIGSPQLGTKPCYGLSLEKHFLRCAIKKHSKKLL